MEEEKNRFHGEGGEVIWSKSDQELYRNLANMGYKWFEAPGKKRIDLTKFKDKEEGEQ